MNTFGGSIAAGLVLATAACQPGTAKQLNTGYAQSKVYIGALTCNVTGSYAGEQASLSAGTSAADGNWLYGGANNQIVLQATQLQTSGADSGYNVAYGIAEITLSLKN
jgi:hypothetical protein